jgi:choline dehydrogenase-like flavoprotein
VRSPTGKLGTLQQVATPPVGLVMAHLPKVLGWIARPLVPNLTGLLAIAEDQPQRQNGVTVDFEKKDRFGLPQLCITHRYSERDVQARRALLTQGKRILRRAGSLATYVHHIKTFSHAVGTLRMGTDPSNSALDLDCRFRGVDNLYVVDGSFMPTSAGLNPSLTIAANALRVGALLTGRASAEPPEHRREPLAVGSA